MQSITKFSLITALLLAGLLWSTPARAQLGPVAGETCTNTGGTSSITCTFSSALTANDLLYICVDTGNGIGPVWSGDSGTFTMDFNNQLWNGGTRRIYCAHVYPLTGGGTVITATGSGGNFSSPIIFGAEFQGVTGFDVAGCAGTCTSITGSGTSIGGQSITTTSSGDLIVSMIGCGAGGVTAGSGYSSAVTQGTEFKIQYRIQSSAGSIQATGTCTSGQWVNQIASFTAPSGSARHRLIRN